MENLSAREGGQGDLPDGEKCAICLSAVASLTFFFCPLLSVISGNLMGSFAVVF